MNAAKWQTSAPVDFSKFTVLAGHFKELWIASFIAILAMAGTVDARAQDSSASQTFAEKIALDLNGGMLGSGVFKCGDSGNKTVIGILPFEAEKIPIDINRADRIYTDVLSVMGKTKPECISYLDENNIRALVTQMTRTGSLKDKGRKALNEFMKANQQVNIIVTGKFHSSGGKIRISFKAFKTVNGQMLAQTSTYELTGLSGGRNIDSAVGLGKALSTAARKLVRQAHKMTALVPGAIYYQDTDKETSFSSYVLNELLPNIGQEKANLVQGEIFKMHKSLPLSENTFKLSGSYWVHEKVVDLRLSLVNKNGETAIWKGRALRSSLKGLELLPKKEPEPEPVNKTDPDDERDFNKAIKCGRKACFDWYLKRYPDGAFVPDILERQAEMDNPDTKDVGENDAVVEPSGDVEPVQQSNLDGRYRGVRGYNDPSRLSPNKHCLNVYRFNAQISNGRLSFSSDRRRWSGSVSSSGQILVDWSGVSPPPKHPIQVTGPLSSASMYSSYCGQGYFRLEKIAISQPAPQQNNVSRFNGHYTGSRGYTDPGRRSPNRGCRQRYSVSIEVYNGQFTFFSDNRRWTGSINANGDIYLDGSGVQPRTKTSVLIRGRLDNAQMHSGYCGGGYLRVTRQ